MKINRLLELTIILLNKGTITAKELAERFGVSARTIYRDVDVLSSAGVPVFMSKGNGGGISLLDNYSLNKALISEHESESLLLALKTLQAAKYPEIDAVLDKIGAVFKNVDTTDWVNIDFSPWGSNPNEYSKFTDIKKAILERMIITFDYINADGGRSNRSIEPMKLIFKGQAWYLWGYCNLVQDFRVFRISRIKNVIVTNSVFIRRNSKDRRKDGIGKPPKKLVKLRLKFYPEVLYRLYDDFDDGLIIKNTDGTCDVTVTFPEDEWVYGYMLSFGCYMEVLEPEHIRDILSDRMKKALGFYEKHL
ncbi:MAG: YafY family transcriptional regulator [Ruminiclostridium sp.]|nr:YafY family transcriptional regulator [Ruminiclostridium sp.]